MLFDQQTAVEQYGDRREAQGEARAAAAATERDKLRVRRMHAEGDSLEKIASVMYLDIELVKEWLAAPTMA